MHSNGKWSETEVYVLQQDSRSLRALQRKIAQVLAVREVARQQRLAKQAVRRAQVEPNAQS